MTNARLLRSGAIYAVANVASAAVPFLLLPILTRALAPDEYGDVVAFYVLVSICASIAGLGLHSAVAVRWLDRSHGDPRQFTSAAIAIVAGSTAVASALAAILAPVFGFTLSAMVCAMAAVLAGANVLQSIRFAVWQTQHRPIPAALLQVSAATCNIVLSLVAVFVLHLGGLGRIAGATLATIGVGLFSISSLRREGSLAPWQSNHIRSLLRFGVPLAPHAMAAAVMASADRFAVAGVLGASSLGVYGTAAQLGSILTVLADAATKAYSPHMYQLLSRRTLRTRLRVVGWAYLSVIGWGVVAVCLWWSFHLSAPLLLGAEYRDAAVGLASWFLAGAAIGAVYLQVAGLFFFSGRTEWISMASSSAALVAMLLAGPLVRAWGLVGGGVLFVTAQLVLLFSALLLSFRVNPMPWNHPLLALRCAQPRRSVP